ncbi:MAG: molybdate ABC transporter substrate-binding protein [Verrucomicrobia bacterium]|nr:molybdate ABC transporter substrate-binding protein [Verrucomicrobiota bacterium]MCH8510826.1 molybdate ABC transporter substrate-binding protein [Kiritimatiellia bacterium]
MNHHRHKLLFLFAILLTGISLVLLFRLDDRPRGGRTKGEPPITLHAAAGLSRPVQRVVEAYERETGRQVNVNFGGSGTLLSGLRVAGRGDLFLAGDEQYIQNAREYDLIREEFPVATMTPVIAVKQGNPKNIQGFADLLREDVRVALSDSRAAAVGVLAKAMLEEAGLWDEVEAAVAARGVFRPTVNGLATDVATGPIDAAIVFDSVANQFDRVETLVIPGVEAHLSRVALGVLAASEQPAAALHFARYLTASDRGAAIFAEEGFVPVPGDPWAEVPEITLFSGGVNRVSIDDALREFEKREGARVNVVYNGCGILVSQMRAGAKPDAYFACDTSYMEDVYERFRDHQLVSATDMVIIAAPGNPRNIRSLADLASPGVRLAICNPDYSALGGLTHGLLRAVDLFDPVIANVTFGDAPTADTVVTRVRTGREDAGIVYRANTTGLGGALEIIEIEHPRARAAQPIAVSVDTRFPALSDRLSSYLSTGGMKTRFEAAGFEYIVGTEMPER